MKNFILTTITLFIILHAGIIDTAFDVKLESLKKEVQSVLNFRKGYKLKLTIKQFNDLAVSNNEIRINNELHDIISLKKKGKLVHLIVVNDQKENLFLTKIKNYKNNTSPQKSKTNLLKAKLLLCSFNPAIAINTSLNHTAFQKLFFYKAAKLSKKLGEIIIPPPDLA
ncbi:hypothetical protein [Flavobacterium sp. T12S277]|uniref:hypothetical protein n=1 Tax=Flavobacterium sp. T12S277 TaxID=3402752 RepID=UPI003AEEEB4A